MKTDAATAPKATEAVRPHSKFGDLVILAKIRVNALVVATTAGGYYMAGPTDRGPGTLAAVCAGTWLVASGAAAINQVYERSTDRLMNRTRLRPVADGRMHAGEGLAIGLLLSMAGLALLVTATTLAATLVAMATLVSYALIYTPLKPVTSLSTVIGAVPGALPPLIGWAAARDSVAAPAGWSLFLILFFWQLPHFLAIAWIYREDYARAGMPMLTVIDGDGGFTGRQAVLWAAALVPFSQLPFLFGLSGPIYAIGALALGIAQLAVAFQFARHRSIANARRLFLASIIYLPLLWILMALSRLT